jgi:voltage-gated potassium channel
VKRVFFLVFGHVANVRWLIAGTIAISVAAATVMRLLTNEEAFDSYSTSLWWAVQTVTTVGYGDVIPDDGTGRIVAGVLMIVGVAFASILTATVTASLVERRRRERRDDPAYEALEVLKRIEERLDALERRG